METPHTNHLTSKDYEHVYEPAEDSFLLLDALEADLPYLESLQPHVCLEIGSGSGLIITALAKKLKSAFCLATDVNAYACSATLRTATHNKTRVETVNGNLVDAIRPHSIDVLVFNPPYVVTTDEELQRPKTENQVELIYSWAGGQLGRRIVDELLPKLDETLSPQGVLYLLLLRENQPDEVIGQLSDLNFRAEKFMERRIPGEYLYVLKVKRN